MHKALSEIYAGMSKEHYNLMCQIIKGRIYAPDLEIAPDGGDTYLYRWHLVKTDHASVYFHLQVRDDPERPLHDHPWDNQSVILANGYDEILQTLPPYGERERLVRLPGDVVWRAATEAHRLLVRGPYCMTVFSTGPVVRAWGFWYGDEWKSFEDVTKWENGRSVHIHEGETDGDE